jgi:hypothetical protein
MNADKPTSTVSKLYQEMYQKLPQRCSYPSCGFVELSVETLIIIHETLMLLLKKDVSLEQKLFLDSIRCVIYELFEKFGLDIESQIDKKH